LINGFHYFVFYIVADNIFCDTNLLIFFSLKQIMGKEKFRLGSICVDSPNRRFAGSSLSSESGKEGIGIISKNSKLKTQKNPLFAQQRGWRCSQPGE